MTLEEMILENLIANEDFARKALPFLKKNYFQEECDKILFTTVQGFITKYGMLPPVRTIELEIDQLPNTRQELITESIAKLKTFSTTPNKNQTQWMLDQSEKWCQERAIFLAIGESVNIMDGRSKNPKTAIPQMLSDALAVAFDSDLGHDYTEDADARYNYIHSDIPRIPLDIELYNIITRNGVARKTLNIIGAGINVGKTLHLCHFAAAYALAGYKVLYITLEMSQEEIAARLDANMMDVELDKIIGLSKQDWDSRIQKIQKKAKGNIVIKEYPTKQASIIQFESFLRELKIKKNFVPDIICVDYLGICSSASLKLGGAINTNTYQGSIAAELRAMAIKNKIAVWTAQQLNRTGFASTDPDMDDVADAFDVPGIADFYLMVTETDELAKLSQYQVKQVKSRYGDKNKHRRFVIGVDKAKQRLFDVSSSAQTLSGGSNGSVSNVHGRGNQKNSPSQQSAGSKTNAFTAGRGRNGTTHNGKNDDKFSRFKV